MSRTPEPPACPLSCGNPLGSSVNRELAANAIAHSRSGRAGGTFTVAVAAGPDGVTIHVHDLGTGDGRVPAPRQAADDGLAEGGRGAADRDRAQYRVRHPPGGPVPSARTRRPRPSRPTGAAPGAAWTPSHTTNRTSPRRPPRRHRRAADHDTADADRQAGASSGLHNRPGGPATPPASPRRG